MGWFRRRGEPGTARDEEPALTEDDVQRLRLWRNLFGSDVGEIARAARADAEILALLAEEKRLEPIPHTVWIVREAMTRLEPAEAGYMYKVMAIVAAIGMDALPPNVVRAGALVLPAPDLPARKHAVRVKAKALEWWLGQRPPEDDDIEGLALSEAARLAPMLGTPDAWKRAVVSLVVEKLYTRGVAEAGMAFLRADAGTADLAHRIEMLDASLWSFDLSFGLLVQSIGAGRPLGRWHSKGGPLGWRDGDPKDASRVAAMCGTLEAWLGGRLDDSETARSLGDPDAYPAKRWLARCLQVCLRNHRDHYYGGG